MSVEDLRTMLGDNADLISFEQKGDTLTAKITVGFVSKGKWNDVHKVLAENGFKYFPKPDSEWRRQRQTPQQPEVHGTTIICPHCRKAIMIGVGRQVK